MAQDPVVDHFGSETKNRTTADLKIDFPWMFCLKFYL